MNMKKIIAGFIGFLVLNIQAAQEPPSQQSAIDGMRTMVLNIKAEEIGLSRESYPDNVFGILMETGYEDNSFTLVVLADGTTSLYFSNGGGIIGAGEHVTVRKASTVLLAGANHFHSSTKPTSIFPYPSAGEVRFYLIGRDGITTYLSKEEKLGNNKDSLSSLFHASHQVISELRKIQEPSN